MNVVFLIGHIVVGVYFVFMGFNHFMNLNMLSEYAQSKGVPAAKLAVAVTGLLLLAGGASLLLWQYLFYGMIALTVFLIPVTFTMHNFWAVEDQQMKMVEMTNFTKNMGLLGFVLIVLSQMA